MEVLEIKLNELILDPANVRTHNEKNLESIKGSLKRFGQQKPIVISKDSIVIAGNGTLEAARALGWESLKAVRSHLHGPEITAYGIADNRSGELATWDMGALIDQLNALECDPVTEGFSAENDFEYLIKQLESLPLDYDNQTFPSKNDGTSSSEEYSSDEVERSHKMILMFDNQAEYDLFSAKMDAYAEKKQIQLGQKALLSMALEDLLGLLDA